MKLLKPGAIFADASAFPSALFNVAEVDSTMDRAAPLIASNIEIQLTQTHITRVL